MKKDLLTLRDITRDDLEKIFEFSTKLKQERGKVSYTPLAGKSIGLIFAKSSTRTRVSFEVGVHELGGNPLYLDQGKMQLGRGSETVGDTAHVLSRYLHGIVIRTYAHAEVQELAREADIPVINAGDGGHNHPTQTLADLLTIHREKGRLNNLTVGFCGDLKFGRTVHSLINALARYSNVKVVLISPVELKIPDYVKHEVLDKSGMEYVETTSIEEYMDTLDVLYMTRIQQERFPDPNEYLRLKDSYILTPQKIACAKPTMRILHPLPRVNEITTDVDKTPYAYYFQQAQNGVYVRQALIAAILGVR